MNGQRSNFYKDWEHFGLLLKNKIKISSKAPTEIQESATLKEGQCQLLMLKSKKSITYPLKILSIKFPRAPAKIRDKEIFKSFSEMAVLKK